MFQFPGLASRPERQDDQVALAGFPHSDISGSMLACSSPKLFAACHVLPRRPVPRHSPCALSRLTSFLARFFASPTFFSTHLPKAGNTSLLRPLSFRGRSRDAPPSVHSSLSHLTRPPRLPLASALPPPLKDVHCLRGHLCQKAWSGASFRPLGGTFRAPRKAPVAPR